MHPVGHWGQPRVLDPAPHSRRRWHSNRCPSIIAVGQPGMGFPQAGAPQPYIQSADRGPHVTASMWPATSALMVLILGVVSYATCCFVLVIIGLVLALQSQTVVRQYPRHPDTGMTSASLWLNAIMLVLTVVLGIPDLILMVAIG